LLETAKQNYRMKTLLVATDSHTQELLHDAFRRREHEVTVVEGVRAACRALQSDSYQLVVFDADDFLTELRDAQRPDLRLAIAEQQAATTATDRCCPRVADNLPIAEISLLHNAPYGVYRSSPEGRFLAANPALVAMLGYDCEKEMLQLDLARDVYQDPEVRQRLFARPGDRLEGEQLDWKRKDGTPITVRVSGLAIRDNSGKRIRVEGIAEDITEQKRAEVALCQSNEELRAIYAATPDGLLIMDVENGRLLGANPAMCRKLGYSAEELTAMSMPSIHPPEDLPHVLEVFETEKSKPAPTAENVPCLRKDGSVLYADITSRHLIYQGRPCLIGFFRDITQRKETERAVRKSEARFRSLFENLPDFVAILDRHATIEFVNHPPPGTSAEELLGTSGFSFVVPEHQKSGREAFQQTLSTCRTQTVEVRDIFGRWWACRLVPMAEEGEVRHVMAISTEITEQKQYVETIEDEQHLLRQLLDLHERDRQLIAYEIHDGFSQQLTGAKLNLDAYKRLPDHNSEESRQLLDTGLQLLGESIDETRRLISGLRPPILDEFGIVAAVDYLVCESRERHGLQIEFNHRVEFGRLAPPLESTIFRIVQESLNNACIHSQSDKIRIELAQRISSSGKERVEVEVCDWGTGFDPDAIEENRFGLRGIRDRARLFRGQVAIETAPGKGTRIAVELPLIEAAQGPDES